MRGKSYKSVNSASKIINFKELSTQLTGSPTKVRGVNTAKKYANKIQQLEDLINVWIDWHKE